jgi:chorismate synthase
MVRFLTAGESHGRALVVILEGLPAGLPVDIDAITRDLRRRQGGYGRGRRMAIECDRAEILSGVRGGETIGGPIAMTIENRDWPNWQQTMAVGAEPPEGATGVRKPPVTRPRPGHADLAGVAKYGREDVRDVLERASARETAARVAAGAIARQLLLRAGIRITSHVFSIGEARLADETIVAFDQADALSVDAPLRCIDPDVERRMIDEIDRAREAGDTKGGAF